MTNPNFTPMSEEQRQLVRMDRLAAQEYARKNLKTEYMDENHWRELSSLFNCRLPGWWIPASETKYLRRAAKKLGIELQDYVDSTGFSTVKQLAKENSNFTALAMVGLLLEYHKENLEIKEVEDGKN